MTILLIIKAKCLKALQEAFENNRVLCFNIQRDAVPGMPDENGNITCSPGPDIQIEIILKAGLV